MAEEKGNKMNKRYIFPVVVPTLLALATVGSAMAGSGVAYQDRGHGSAIRDLIIEPGTDPSSVQLHFADAERIGYSGTGSLEIVSKDGHAWHYRPQVYQVVNGKRKTLTVTFSFIGHDRVGLKVLGNYDPSAPLVVTPVAGAASTM